MNEELQKTSEAPVQEEKVGGLKRGLRRLRPSGGKKKLSRRKRILLILAAATAVLAIVLVVRNRAAKASAKAVTYTEEDAAARTIVQALTSSGTLEAADSYTVTTLVEGNIIAADFSEGDTVEKDTVLYQIDSSDVSNNIEKAQLSLDQAQRNYENTADNAYVRATVAGSVYSLDVSVGDEVKQGQTIATIRNSSTMKLTVPFPADDAKGFYVGQSATVTLDNSFETLYGTVESISGSDIVSTGNSIVRNVTISVKNPGGLGSSQAATATIGGINCAAGSTFSFRTDSTITASSSGTVVAINAKEGASVSKNQAIVTLGGSDLDDAIQSASDQLTNANLSMKSSQDQLDNYTITSPIAGTIIDKQYKTGDKVESGTTLCTIYDLSYLQMTMSIDELDISKVSVGQNVSITADAVEGKTYTGTITKVSVAGTTSNGATTYPVTVRIDEYDDLLPGMNVDAQIIISEADNVLAIPSGAVSRGNLVLITDDSPSASNALTDQENVPDGYVYVQVETGISDDDYIEISSGLQEGDTVAYVKTAATDATQQTNNMMMGGMGGGGMPSGGGGGMPSGGGGGGMPGGGPQG